MTDTERNNPPTRSFGPWRFDANTGKLSDGSTETLLKPRAARLLEYFLTHQDILISRAELISAVWDNKVVSYDALNRRISLLRQILTPDDKSAFIETVVRRGFISHFPPPDDDPEPDAERPQRKNHLIPGVLAAVVGAAIIVYIAFTVFTDVSAPVDSPPRKTMPMVAVLPFVTSGLAGDSEFFANGVHDDLLTQLAQLQSLRVVSRTSVSEYRDSNRNIRDIGRELQADAILEGGVQRVGDQIRINVQLIDAHSDTHLWASQYDRELTPANIFAIQSEIARAIATALQATLTAQEVTQMGLLPTENMAAYRAYHEAMEIRETDTIDAPGYIAALEDAVARDPQFVRAWAELAGSLSYANIRGRDADSIQRLEKMLEHIQSLAPQSPEHVIAQSYYAYYILKDYRRAYELIEQAQSLKPSDAPLLELKSWIQRRLGDYEGKIETIRLARALDPRNPYWTIRLVNSLITDHRYDEALQEVERFPIQNLRLAVLRSMLQMKDHRDPERRLQDLAALQREFNTTADPLDLWEAHIAARDYALADEVLGSRQAEILAGGDGAFVGIPGIELPRLITLWFLDAPDQLNPLRIETRAKLDKEWNSEADYFEANRYLAMAFVIAAEGDTQETELLVRTWQRKAAADLAELVNHRHHSCRALGMSGATSAAVECIRSGLAEPSLVMPFIEPFMPYYDSMRNDPEFVELLAEAAAL